VFVMNVIDFEHRLEALASIHRTLSQVFETVEIWTEQRAPEPGQRLVFVLVASNNKSPVDSLILPSPDRKRFGVLSQRFEQSILGNKDALILTDDYAPIDRLLGPG